MTQCDRDPESGGRATEKIIIHVTWPFEVATLSKAWVCGLSLAEM